MENLEPRQLLAADPVISEFVALNTNTIADADGDFSDWIELQNRGDMSANLDGYYLTNDASDLTKWQIPAGTNLDAGGFLLVFASEKDRTAGELHTNFTIEELGGDLLLVHSDGSTIVSDFSDHAALGANQSYGSYRPSGDAEFIAAGANLRYLVPGDASLGASWTGAVEPYDDSVAAGWTDVPGPIGFDTSQTADGFTVELWDVGSATNLAQVDAAIAGGNPDVVEAVEVINFSDGGGGNFPGTPFPGGIAGDGYVMRATTTFFISGNQAGLWTLGFNSDDGGRLRIDGENVIVDDANHAPADLLASVNLSAGPHELEYVFWENTGGASSELWAAKGQLAAFNSTDFGLIGDPNGPLPLANLDDQITSDIEADMFGQNGSVYARYNFNVDAPEDVTSLTLNVNYDDGAVIYFNGAEVFSENVPAAPTFNSTALADTGIANERIDLTPMIGLLRPGNNVVAIHGMNAGASDEEYIAEVSLLGRESQSEVTDVIDVPTPNSTNGVVIPVITEFLADNQSVFGVGLDDEDGDSSDWIEIFNPGLIDIELVGWYLTDDPLELDKWQFPETRLEAGEYLVVFASGKDRAVAGQELHTNFSLQSDGEYVALLRPDGTSVVWEYGLNGQLYQQQFSNVSFGLRGDAVIDDGTLITDTDPVQGLVAYWDFEEGTGTVANDVSGNGGTGTLVGMAASDWQQGRNGSTTALNFDGVDNVVTTNLTASDLGFSGDTQRTVAGWAQAPAFFQGTNGGFFEVGEGDNGFAFRTISPLGTILALEHSADTDLTTSVDANAWFHFAVTYDGATVKLYVDGELKGERLSPDLDTNDEQTFAMGTWETSFLRGKIDEIAVWDMDIGADSIDALSNEALTPFSVPTVNRLIGIDRNGYEVRQVNASASFPGQILGEVGGGGDPLSDVDLLLGLPSGNPGIANEVTFTREDINMADNAVAGDFGLFGNDRAFPLDDFFGDDDHFALSADATLTVPAGAEGEFEFVIHSDEGVRLRIDGDDVIFDNTRHLASFQTGTMDLAAGDHTIELVYFEHTGAASLELSYASLNSSGAREGTLQLLSILPSQLVPDVAPNVFSADRVFFNIDQTTPGSANTFGVETFLAANELSHTHGFYNEPFQLLITNERPNVDIYYTFDGTEPSEENPTAFLYNGPITIDETTTIRATATLDNAAPSRTSTATYLFIDDVLTQSPNGQRPAGVPTNWTPSGTPSIWGMDPDIVNDSVWGPQMEAALTQIPSFSLVMDLEDLFGQQGIYTNAGQRGRDWERPGSAELIYPDGLGPDDGFTVNAGIRVRGGFSRDNGNPKHAFRLFFRAEYGDAKLNYDLFDEPGADVFDKMDLRTTQNYSWAFQNDSRNTFLRDIFSRDLQMAMGQPSTRGDYYHLYVNGMYWGLFQTQERPDANYAATNYGGNSADYDVFHNVNPGGQGSGRSLGAIDGNLDASQRLWDEFVKPGGLSDANMEDYYRVQGMNPDGTRNTSGDPAFERLLDVDNLIGYMIITYYTSDADGPGSEFTRPGINNYFGFYNRQDPDGMKFLEWDSEHSLDTGNPAGANYNMVSPYVNNGANFSTFNAHWMHEQLADQNSDYRQRFIDTFDKLTAPGGMLDPDNVKATLQTRADEFDLAIIAESARWGDAKRAAPFTKTTWENAVNATLNWVTNRNEQLHNEFRCAGDGGQNVANPNPQTCNPANIGWYPSFNNPIITPAGGVVDDGTMVDVTVPGDFAFEDSVLSSSAVIRWTVPDQAFENSVGQGWVDPAYNFAGWTFGVGDVGYENGSGYEDLIRANVPSGTTTVYVRPFVSFNVNDEDNDGSVSDEFDEVTLRVRYDDGFIAYLNGQEIVSANAPANPAFNSVATTTHDDAAAVVFEDFVLDQAALDLLRETGNALAFHALNAGTGSSDFLLGWELVGRRGVGSMVSTADVYYTLDGSDPRASGNDPGATAILHDDTPFAISGNTLVRTRAFEDGLWSSIFEEFYQVTEPTLAITEINYNPHDPTDAELLAIPALDNDDFEFIEIQNNGSIPTSLAGVSFTNGITFDFPSVTLATGEMGVVVRNRAAFELRYGDGVNVLGTYGGSLNNGGETIELVDGTGASMLNFEYNDAEPWSQTADGRGGTLEFLNVNASNNLYSKYYSWRGSSDFGGSPGTTGSGPVGVVVNEVLAHTDAPLMASDSIELLNTTSAAIDISGWYLSDAGGTLLKYRIPDGTVLGAGQTIAFDESHFNPTPMMPADNDFALSGTNGDDVYVVIPAGNGGVRTLVDDVHFGPSLNGVSFGRVPNGTGLLTPLGRSSLGCENGAHQVGELVISEVNYNPELPNAAALEADPNITSGDLEFIEIHNPTGSTIDLTDWRIRGGVDLDFEDDTSIAAGATVLLIPFNPDSIANASRVAAFNAHYGINGVPLVGGYDGQLSGNGERVQLQRPDEPPLDDPTNIPHVSEDQILYDTLAPWSSTANGMGDSLQRNAPTFYGNSVTSWSAATPSPGTVSFAGGITGDLNGDRAVNALDIDMLNGAVNGGQSLVAYDLDGSGNVDIDDTIFLVESILGTFMGDTNLDGRVDSADLNQVGIGWQQTGGCLTWAKGNIDGDNDVDVSDLNFVGINWQSGVAAAATRVPRAPLAIRVETTATDAVMADNDNTSGDAKVLSHVQAWAVEPVERSTQRVADRLLRRQVRRFDTLATQNQAQHNNVYAEKVDELLASWRR